MDVIFQDITTSKSAHRKGSDKLISAIRNKKNHEDFFSMMLVVLESKKETSNLQLFFKFLEYFFEKLGKGMSIECSLT